MRTPTIAGRSPLEMAQRIEHTDALDVAVGALSTVARPVAEGPNRPLLAGNWLGHSLHPMLTDFPLGCWTSASLLDLVGGRAARKASRRLVGLGILTALPTAVTGLSDWAHTDRPSQRVGVVHAAANTVALLCYVNSYTARLRRRHFRGIGWALVGGVVAVGGGYLGGHLSLTAAVTRDNALLADADAEAERVAVSVVAGDASVIATAPGTVTGSPSVAAPGAVSWP